MSQAPPPLPSAFQPGGKSSSSPTPPPVPGSSSESSAIPPQQGTLPPKRIPSSQEWTESRIVNLLSMEEEEEQEPTNTKKTPLPPPLPEEKPVVRKQPYRFRPPDWKQKQRVVLWSLLGAALFAILLTVLLGFVLRPHPSGKSSVTEIVPLPDPNGMTSAPSDSPEESIPLSAP